MELRTNLPQKTIIDCLTEEETGYGLKGFALSDLYSQKRPVEFFEIVEEKGILRGLDYKDALIWCINLLDRSHTASLLLKEAMADDWYIVTEDLQSGDYCIDVEDKVLILNNGGLSPIALSSSEYFRNVMMANLIKALRDIWQETRYGGFDEDYAPVDVILMERLRSADLDVVSILVAWELRSEAHGYKQLWRHMVGSKVNDMAMIFSHYQENSLAKEVDYKGLVAVFRQWFEDADRKKSCDHETLEYLDEVLATTDFVNPFGNKKPAKMNVETLSLLPDNISYLQGCGHEILSNRHYYEAEGDINKAHLSHIMNDIQSIIVENVAFRDADLARKIFPDGFLSGNSEA